MTIDIGIVFSLIACIVAVIGLFRNSKKDDKSDGLSLRYFYRRNEG